MADPDRQETVAVDGLQQHDRLFADHVEAHAVDLHLLQSGLRSRLWPAGNYRYGSRAVMSADLARPAGSAIIASPCRKPVSRRTSKRRSRSSGSSSPTSTATPSGGRG